MKKLLILLLFISYHSFSQVNPWKSIGKEAPEILTLTNGEYPEIFENDSIRIISGIIYNTITKKVIGFVEKDTLYSEATLEPEIVSRWLSRDPLAHKYPSLNPYNFVANTPLQAVDPDGRVIIFINGFWGPIGDIDSPNKGYWGDYWISQLKKHWGDENERYFDGSVGGQMSLKTNKHLRFLYGKAAGLKNAQAILSNLKEGETIKYVTNSMGAAYQRGFSKGIHEYIDVRTADINSKISTIDGLISSYNKEMATLYNNDGSYNSQENYDRAQILDGLINMQQANKSSLEQEKDKLNQVITEIVVDIEPFQATKRDVNAKNHYYVLSDNTKKSGFEKQLLIMPVEGATDASTKNGKPIMKGHHNSYVSPKDLPKP